MHSPKKGLLRGWTGPFAAWLRKRWQKLTAALGPVTAPTPVKPSLPPATEPPQRQPRADIVEIVGSASAVTGRLRMLPWVSPSRDYLTLTPSTPRNDIRLLVLIHGCRQEPHGFAAATRIRELVASGDWIVLLPNQTRRANLHRCWNWFDLSTAAGAGEVAITLAMIETICKRYLIQPGRCFVAGMSSGAGLAAAIVGHAPERFAAAAFHSGVAMGASQSALHARRVLAEGPETDVTLNLPTHGNMPAIVIHGRKDEVVAESHAHELMRQILAINGELDPGDPLPAPSQITPLVTEITYAASLASYGASRLMMIDELGHAWSGGDSNWPYNDPKGPDATSAILAFFEQHVTN